MPKIRSTGIRAGVGVLYYTDEFVLPLPPDHRFPMRKYADLRQRVALSAFFTGIPLVVPPAATDDEILRVHTESYLRKVVSGELSPAEIRRLGFPWSQEMVERSRRSSGATIAACRTALQSGVGINMAGGTHHAYTDRAEGFCIFNDSVIAARALQFEGLVRRVLIIDLDVHQGNGTAAIVKNDPSIFAFSIHGERNYPLEKEIGDLDIALPDETGDCDYLAALEGGLLACAARFTPDLMIYLAGADPYVGDKMGRMALSKDGLAERDNRVFEFALRHRLPVAISMAGGYCPNIDEIVDIHFATISAAVARLRRAPN